MKRDTRQDILNTAQALFREKGYNAVSVGEIAAALGISNCLLYTSPSPRDCS